MITKNVIKQRITIVVYTILSLVMVYTRAVNDFELYKMVKYILIPSLVCYYFAGVSKKKYKFLLILLFYYLADVLFTISPWHQYFGFSSLVLSQAMLSCFLLYRMGLVRSSSFYQISLTIALLLVLGLAFFYEAKMFQFVLLTVFFSSILLTFIVAYFRYAKAARLFSFYMLIATLFFVFSNFMSTLNYFVCQSFVFSSLSSLAYVIFLFVMVRSELIETRQENSKELPIIELKEKDGNNCMLRFFSQ